VTLTPLVPIKRAAAAENTTSSGLHCTLVPVVESPDTQSFGIRAKFPSWCQF